MSLSSAPRLKLTGLMFALLAIGFGLTGYYGLEWYQLPRYSDADIATSADWNLLMDLQRLGIQAPSDPQELERMRAEVRTDVENDIANDRRPVLTGLAIGLAALLLGLGQCVIALRQFRSQRP